MITRPSIQELIEGLERNFVLLGDTAPGPMQAPFLTVLDRLGNEWSGWSTLLAEDNDDIRSTLTGLGATDLPPASNAVASLATAGATAGVAAMEAENRALKDALVVAIEQFDLPAGPGASAERQAADQAVVALLLRSLHRETRVVVAPPRQVANSGNPSSAAISLEALGELISRFLRAQMPDATSVRVEALQRLTGGASREAWIFDAHWQVDDQQHFEPCILMREPLASVLTSDSGPETIDGTRRTVHSEIRVVRAMAEAGIPAPSILWADPDGEWFERPFSIARRLPGTADYSALPGSPAAGPILDQFVEILARIHALDPAAAGVSFLGTPTPAEAAGAQVDQFEANYHAQRLEAFPATTYLVRWLRGNQPVASRVGVVHGDYRLGNFLFEGDRIVAILDWEQVHVGDPIEEIAFMYWVGWPLDLLCPIDEFVQRYERATGTVVDRDTLAWYRVFIELKMLVVLLTGQRSYFATPERQLHYASPQANEMIRDSQLRAIEELARGGPTVAFNAYRKAT